MASARTSHVNQQCSQPFRLPDRRETGLLGADDGTSVAGPKMLKRFAKGDGKMFE